MAAVSLAGALRSSGVVTVCSLTWCLLPSSRTLPRPRAGVVCTLDASPSCSTTHNVAFVLVGVAMSDCSEYGRYQDKPLECFHILVGNNQIVLFLRVFVAGQRSNEQVELVTSASIPNGQLLRTCSS